MSDRVFLLLGGLLLLLLAVIRIYFEHKIAKLEKELRELDGRE